MLPGAYSAYNMNSLTKLNDKGHTLLKEYFKSIDQKIQTNHIHPADITPLHAFFQTLLP